MSKFLTGHEAFDEIVRLKYGDLLLIVDDNLSEAGRLLDAVFPKRGLPHPLIELTLKKKVCDTAEAVRLNELYPTYLSAEVNKQRASHRRWAFIHSYLPEAIVVNDTDTFLKVLQAWGRHAVHHETVEFLLLPRNAFMDAEKKMRAIVDGVVELEASSGKMYMTPIRCCKPEHHLKRFEYLLDEGRLLIKLTGGFADRLSTRSEDEVLQRAQYLRENRGYLRVVRGPVATPQFMELEDRLLLSQVIGRDLEEALLLFAEEERLVEKMVKWHVEGYIDFVRCEPSLSPNVKAKLSPKTKLTLLLPTRIASKLISRAGMSRNRVPAQAYWLRMKVDEAYFSLALPPDAFHLLTLEGLEEYLQDVATRMMTYDIIRRVGEDPRNALDLRHLPKIVALMLSMGYTTDAKVIKVSENAFEIVVKNCPVCLGLHSDAPACGSLAGAIRGNAAMCFKKNFRCSEKSCKAVGDDLCAFVLEVVKDAESGGPNPAGRLHAADSQLLAHRSPPTS